MDYKHKLEKSNDLQIKNLFTSLNRDVHSVSRLFILHLLHVKPSLTFSEIKKITGFTSGRLIVHCNKLNECDYIHLEKKLTKDGIITLLTISKLGIYEYQKYVKKIRQIFDL